MSAPNINKLLDLWASTLLKHNDLQIANFPLLILPRKLTNLTSLNMFDDSSMISCILTATSLRLTYL